MIKKHVLCILSNILHGERTILCRISFLYHSIIICYLFTNILKVMLPCNELLVACQWQGKMENCGQLFSLTKSDSGFCCAFNLIETDGQL